MQKSGYPSGLVLIHPRIGGEDGWGAYASPSEVCEAAIRSLADHEEYLGERLDALNHELHQRLASLDRGEHVDPEAVRERIRQKSELRKSVPS